MRIRLLVVVVASLTAVLPTAIPTPTPASAAPVAAATPGDQAGLVPPVPFDTWDGLVDQLHRDLIGRAPTSAERSAATTALADGTLTAGQLVALIRAGADHTGLVDPAVRLYRAALGRAPDLGGYQFWTARRRTGTWSLVRVAGHLATSPEFQRRYGNLANRAYVERIYTNVLGRPSDPAGATYWTRRLDRGTSGRGHVLAAISESNEHRTKTGPDTTADVLFLTLLRRLPTPVERSRVTTALRAHLTTSALATNIVADHEHARRHGHTGPHTHHLTTTPDGRPADESSWLGFHGGMTPDAAAVAFISPASNLTGEPGGPASALHLWQRFAGVTSIDVAPEPGASGVVAAISDDGQTIAYATALDRTVRIWLLDRPTDGRTLVAELPTSATTSDDLVSLQVSGDGAHVVYSVPPPGDLDDGPPPQQVSSWERATGLTTLVSSTPLGAPGNGRSDAAAVDADGSTIAFVSTATDLVSEDSAEDTHAYVWDRATGRSRRVPLPASLPPGTGATTALLPRISADGLTVAYWRYRHTADAPIPQVVVWRDGDEESQVVNRQSDLSVQMSIGLGLSADGDHVVHHETPSSAPRHATRWSRTTGATREVAIFEDHVHDRLALNHDGGAVLVNTPTPLAPTASPSTHDSDLYLIHLGP